MRRKRPLAPEENKKNFLPTLILTILFWGILVFTVLFIDPDTAGIVPIFFAVLFMALLFTLAILFANTRRGLLITLAVTIFAILRYFQVGNILNLILLAGVAAALDIYFSQKKRPGPRRKRSSGDFRHSHRESS